jgi:MFS family permease
MKADKAQAVKGTTDVMVGEEVWRKTSLACLCLISAIKGADMQLLPASFRAMEVSLNIDPLSLAFLALCQGVAAAVSGPMWGNLVDSGVSRKNLLVFGTIAWGWCTICLGFVNTLEAMGCLRVLNGVALAVLAPITQSFVADLSSQHSRGQTFGTLIFFSNIGQVLTCIFVTPLSNQKVFWHEGWRVALIIVGLVSMLISMLIPKMLVEAPRRWRPDRLGLGREMKKLSRFLKIPSFNVIVLQGIFGTVPSAAFAFITMYFQYIGISDFAAALVISLHVIGDGCGGYVGGLIGDALADWSPRFGRAITAQISTVLCLPFLAAIFVLIPRNSDMVMIFGGTMFLYGFVSSWVAPGCIGPVVIDIVPRSCLGSAFAWELAFVYCSGNLLGPLLVAVLSEDVFNYHLSNEAITNMDEGVRAENARALGKSLLLSCIVPYVICAVVFSALFFTHQKDSIQREQMSNSELEDQDEFVSREVNVEAPTEASQLCGSVTA